MAFQIEQALEYVKSVDLRGTPRGLIAQSAESEAGEVFNQAKNQAQVVGAGVFSFAQGVTAAVREAISDSALLAQLVASKKASAKDKPLEWFDAYSECLQNVGWVLQEGTWTDYTAKGTAAEVHEKIIEVVKAALTPGAAAISILTSTIDTLKAMKSGSPWITLFSRESQKAPNLARFQIGLVEKEEKDDVLVSLLGCLIEAESTITQILFFKYREAKASFRARSAKVSINKRAVGELGPFVRGRIRAYQADYLSSLVDL